MRILVLGASGMLGSATLRLLSRNLDWTVYGTLRYANASLLNLAPNARLIVGIHAEQSDDLVDAFVQSQPDVVINCVGIVKQLACAEEPLQAIPINGLLPHRLAKLCEVKKAKLIHISTDCVFSGRAGGYIETDIPDAEDLYGRSKLLGEVNYPHAITLRTSIIGHELGTSHSLIEWFLAQRGLVKGYVNAIFSGLPTNELGRIIRDFVIPSNDLFGVYHVAGNPISKYDLLNLVNDKYRLGVQIVPDDTIKIDRSLNASRFRDATGYVAPDWSKLINSMYEFR